MRLYQWTSYSSSAAMREDWGMYRLLRIASRHNYVFMSFHDVVAWRQGQKLL